MQDTKSTAADKQREWRNFFSYASILIKQDNCKFGFKASAQVSLLGNHKSYFNLQGNRSFHLHIMLMQHLQHAKYQHIDYCTEELSLIQKDHLCISCTAISTKLDVSWCTTFSIS